jgi:uncharacterized membrane protein
MALWMLMVMGILPPPLTHALMIVIFQVRSRPTLGGGDIDMHSNRQRDSMFNFRAAALWAFISVIVAFFVGAPGMIAGFLVLVLAVCFAGFVFGAVQDLIDRAVSAHTALKKSYWVYPETDMKELIRQTRERENR